MTTTPEETAEKKLSVFRKAMIKAMGPTVFTIFDGQPPPVSSIPSGSLSLDVATGIGGFPQGKVVEIYGPPGGGKSTLASCAVAENLRAGRRAMYIDVEHKIDPRYMQACGVDVLSDDFLLVKPTCAEDTMRLIISAAEMDAIDLVIVDSVSALITRAELESDPGDVHVGIQARLMSQNLKHIHRILKNTCVVFLNQTRVDIGKRWGNPEVTSAGKALLFYASLRVRLSMIKLLGPEKARTGQTVKTIVKKNSCAAPYRTAEFDIVYGSGIHHASDILSAAKATGVITTKGPWSYYLGERIANGTVATQTWLEENPQVADEISRAVRATMQTK